MKKTNLFMMLAAMLLSFVSCTSDEMEVMGTPVAKGDYTVRFSMDNPSSKVQSRAYTTDESKINQLYAVVFDGSTFTDATPTGSEALKGVYFVDVVSNGTDTYDCSFRMDRSGTFAACFVANPYDGLLDAIKGAATVNDFKALVASQSPETFLMVSEAFHPFDLTELGTVDLSAGTDGAEATVKLVRNVARIDIENTIEGLVISQIFFANRAVKSVLWNDDNTSTVASDAASMAGKTYTVAADHSLNADVTATTTGKYEAEIYTYEQYATADNVPSLSFTYTLNGKQYNKPLGLEFKKDGNYVPLKRNTKYTVKIKMGNNKINFEITVLDYVDGETYTLSVDALADKETAIRPDQTELNEALMVNMFTEYNVASIAGSTVTFETSLHNNESAPGNSTNAVEGGYYTWEAAMQLQSLVDDQGTAYRLPTAGELNLLLPDWSITNKVTKHPWWNDAASNTDGNVMTEDEFTETVYLRNKADGYRESGENYDFRGKSRMKKGTQKTEVTYGNAVYNVYPVYAYRFKGTDQFAAYRWESKEIEGGSGENDRYFSIKIKALSNYHDSDVTIDEIADEAFWADGYIEYTFPASGYYHYQNNNLTNRGVNGYCWSSSRNSETNARNLNFNLNNANVNNNNVGNKFPLRLVKVSQEVALPVAAVGTFFSFIQ